MHSVQYNRQVTSQQVIHQVIEFLYILAALWLETDSTSKEKVKTDSIFTKCCYSHLHLIHIIPWVKGLTQIRQSKDHCITKHSDKHNSTGIHYFQSLKNDTIYLQVTHIIKS